MPPLLIAILVVAGGYFGYQEYLKSKVLQSKTVTTPSWLPNIPPITKTYNDYKIIQITPETVNATTPYIVAWNLNLNQPIQVGVGNSMSVSQQENVDMNNSGIPGSIFWMNVNGVANRIYTPVSL
jgi:hypothetical protein